MKKIFIFIFLLSFISQAQAYDCPFDKLKPGVNKKDLEEINLFLPRNQEGINIVPIRAEEICKGDPKDVMGLEIHLIFFDDKLIKINYINTLSISTVLLISQTMITKLILRETNNKLTKNNLNFMTQL